MINKENLFTHNMPDTPEHKTPNGDLEAYTVDELPIDLARIRDNTMSYGELAEKHTSLINKSSLELAGFSSRDEAAVAQLDLVFMMGSYLPSGNFSHCPDKIIELAQRIAEEHQLSPHMDYELVIDINSREFENTGKMRTFLDGEQGLAERDFYYGHHLSEQHIKDVAMQLNSLVMNSQLDNESILTIFTNANASMREFKEHMAKYAKLSREAFGSMRPYLASYPNGKRNASGAFMPSVQLAELMLHTPSQEHQMYIEESMPYFPSWSRDLMAEWRELSLDGANITSLLESGALSLDADSMLLFEKMIDDFYRFRAIHMGITKKQIPEAFTNRTVPTGREQIKDFGEPDIMADGVVGTAGFDVVNILGGSASRLASLQDKVEQLNNTNKVTE